MDGSLIKYVRLRLMLSYISPIVISVLRVIGVKWNLITIRFIFRYI